MFCVTLLMHGTFVPFPHCHSSHFNLNWKQFTMVISAPNSVCNLLGIGLSSVRVRTYTCMWILESSFIFKINTLLLSCVEMTAWKVCFGSVTEKVFSRCWHYFWEFFPFILDHNLYIVWIVAIWSMYKLCIMWVNYNYNH